MDKPYTYLFKKLWQNHFVTTFLFMFFIFGLISILHHEMWRDELQSWLQATRSSSLSDLFKNMTYERHPRLWHISLFLIARVIHSPLAMQIFHLLIASTTAFIVLKYAPFEKYHKVLFIFGYFPFYEYAVISRNYALGVLFIFLVCALYPDRKKYFILIAFLLFLMCQTTAFGMLFAMCFAFILIFELVFVGKNCSIKPWSIVLFLTLFLAGVFLSLKQTQSPDARLGSVFQLHIKPFIMALSFASIWQSYFPLPQLIVEFWNTNIISIGEVRALLSLVLFTVALLLLHKKFVPLLFYVIGTAGCLFMEYQFFIFLYSRHFGHLFIVLIVALWLSNYYQDSFQKSRLIKKIPDLKRWKPAFITTLFLVHFMVGIYANAMDLIHPFTASKVTAEYIKENQLDKKYYMVGDFEEAASSVTGHLDAIMYYPRRDYEGSFIFYRNRIPNIRSHAVMRKAFRIAEERAQDVLLVFNYKPNTRIYPVTKLPDFTYSIVPDEKYYLYLIRHTDQAVESEDDHAGSGK